MQLFNIVVDTEDTGKQLLQNGKLKRRYTIIPLNKISSRCISADVVKKAQSLVSWPSAAQYGFKHHNNYICCNCDLLSSSMFVWDVKVPIQEFEVIIGGGLLGGTGVWMYGIVVVIIKDRVDSKLKYLNF